MVAVPGGTFEMGTRREDRPAVLAVCEASGFNCLQTAWTDNEEPGHPVTISPFWIDETEVTSANFAAFLNAARLTSTEAAVYIKLTVPDAPIEVVEGRYRARPGLDRYPATRIYWAGAAAYCRWADARLPTEAEWEYAAGGPQRTMFPWGNDFDGTKLNFWSASDGYAQIAPVAAFPEGASWVRALNMSGNVAEWVADWYAPYTFDAATDPQGPAAGDRRIVRGGSAYDSPMYARVMARSVLIAGETNASAGFRCAKDFDS